MIIKSIFAGYVFYVNIENKPAAKYAPDTPRGLIETGNGEGGAVRNQGL